MQSSAWILAVMVPLAGLGVGEACFVAAPLRSGQKVRLTATSDLAVHVAVKYRGKTRKEVDFPDRIAFDCTASMVQPEGAAASAGRVAFGKAQEIDVDELGGDPIVRTPAYSDRAYEIARRGGALDLVRAVRGGLTRREHEIANWVARATLATPPLGGWLAGRTLQVGDVVDPPAAIAQEAIGPLASDAQVKSLRLTLAEARTESTRELATFRAAATLLTRTRTAAPFSVAVDLAGRITIDRGSGLVVALTLDGPVEVATWIEQDGRKLELQGRGTWKLEYTATIE